MSKMMEVGIEIQARSVAEKVDVKRSVGILLEKKYGIVARERFEKIMDEKIEEGLKITKTLVDEYHDGE